jgi:hypothetical protein
VADMSASKTYSAWRGCPQGGDYEMVPESQLTDAERQTHGLPPKEPFEPDLAKISANVYEANYAIDAFARITDMRESNEDDETILRDLLANLMHWCDCRDIDFDEELATARTNYLAEIEGE